MERLAKVEQTWVGDDGKERKKVVEFDEEGAVKGAGKGAEESLPPGSLPADFPGRDIFRRAGYGTVEDVRQFRRRGPFTRIEGIDSLTAQAAEVALANTPEDDGAAAAATSADAKATATNTKVSESGGGSEAVTAAPPAPDTRRGAKADGSVGSDSTLGDVADATNAQGTPVAGHGVEGFIVGDPNNPGGSHLTTNLTVASGATKTKPASIGDEGDEDGVEDETALPKGKLPADFPHRKELEEAGLGTYAKLRKAIAKGSDWHKDVTGIGDKKAEEIEATVDIFLPSEE